MSSSSAAPLRPLPSLPLVFGPEGRLAEVVKACARIAPTDSTVLLTGETGTGKEVFARFIHQNSSRAGRPFVPVNCGAIPETLLESELFGYVKGAFTGAIAARKGRLALAEGGTLFLDEIGDLPLALQVKLLRVLQERSYEPVGSSESVSANFRLVAATHRDLAQEVEAGRFRRDLYYRLLVCPQELPSLRERKSDIPRLFNFFWNARGETRPVESDVLLALEAYPWPGNVRELENLVERISVCTEGESIRLADLPVSFRPGTPSAPRPLMVTAPVVAKVERIELQDEVSGAELRALIEDDGSTTQMLADNVTQLPDPRAGFPIDLPLLLRKLEDTYIVAALNQARGNKKAAADLLGLQRTTLVEKLKRRNRDSAVVQAA